jgi:hypothetical protein
MAQPIPTTASLLEAVDERTRLLHTGRDSPANLAGFLGTVDVDLDVLDPPELRTLLRRLAARFDRAAGQA